MKNVLTRKDLPYFLTLVVGLLGWTVTHLAERMLDSPTLEYDIVEVRPTASDETLRRIWVRNISRSRKFDQLVLSLVAVPDSARITSATYSPRPPADLDERIQNVGSNTASLRLPSFHPGWAIKLKVVTQNASVLQLKTKSSDPVRLIAANLETWLVRHEFQLLVGLGLGWLALLVIYIVLLPNRPNIAKAPGKEPPIEAEAQAAERRSHKCAP